MGDGLTQGSDPDHAMLDARFQALFADQQRAMQGQPASAAVAPSVAEIREAYRTERLSQDRSPPQDIATVDMRVPGGAGKIDARLYVPVEVPERSALLIYFHGGGFVIGGIDTHDGLCRRLAKGTAAQVLAIDYRLAPECPFPAAHDDAIAATTWCFENADVLHVDPARIAVGGDSAGANIAASTVISMAASQQGRVIFQLLLYPLTWPDVPTASRTNRAFPVLTEEHLAWFEACLQFRGNPAAWRTQLGAAKLTGLPPTLVVTAGHDPLRDEGRAFAATLSAQGNTVEHVEFGDLPHDFFVMPDVSPRVEYAVAAIVDRVRQAIA